MTAFVLGNGVSRRDVSVDSLKQLGAVYGCNALYRTHSVTALVATDDKIARAIEESGYPKTHRFYTRRPQVDSNAQLVPRQYHGFSSGPIAAGIAALDGNQKIFLLGFDMAPDKNGKFNNIYAGTEFYKPLLADPTYTGNWIKQLIRVMGDFPTCEFVRIHGETTAEIPEFLAAKNHSAMCIQDFIGRINTSKDL